MRFVAQDLTERTGPEARRIALAPPGGSEYALSHHRPSGPALLVRRDRGATRPAERFRRQKAQCAVQLPCPVDMIIGLFPGPIVTAVTQVSGAQGLQPRRRG